MPFADGELRGGRLPRCGPPFRARSSFDVELSVAFGCLQSQLVVRRCDRCVGTLS